MEEEKQNNFNEEEQEETRDPGDVLLGWEVPEYEQPPKSRTWYLAAGLAGLAGLIYALFTSNFLFALIIIIAAVILILTEGQEPQRVAISLTDEGLILGKRFYDYDEFKNFSIVYKPKQDVKNLYFEFHNFFRHRITIPLEDVNPVKVRDILADYLPEDTERTDPPLSEQLSRMLKI